MTEAEEKAMELSAALWDALCGVVTDGPNRDADLSELIVPLHAIQRYIMSNEAARQNPGRYRLLGESLRMQTLD